MPDATGGEPAAKPQPPTLVAAGTPEADRVQSPGDGAAAKPAGKRRSWVWIAGAY